MPNAASQIGSICHETAASNRSTDIPFATTNSATNSSTDATRLLIAELQNLSNDQVTRQVLQLNRKQHLVDAELLIYLSELDSRKLYRNHACSSLFDFLTARLKQSGDVAYRWMWGARLLRVFPLVYELLGNGRIHLSALMLLKLHLTEENHRDWLIAAAGKSKREVEKLVAARHPKPDVPTRVRMLPKFAPIQSVDSGERPFAEDTRSVVTQSLTATPSVPTKPSVPSTSKPSPAVVTQPSLQEPLSPRLDMPSRTTKIQPWSEHSYRVEFTASRRLKEKMDRAHELVSHAITPTDLPALVERAMDLLIEREERRRYGSSRGAAVPSSKDVASRTVATNQRSKAAIGADVEGLAPRSRRVPAQVRRYVWERDAGRCSYVDADSRRCQSRHRLEFDHRIAHALDGAPTVDNIRLRCRAHNALAAEQVFGLERITAAITAAREHRHRTGAKTHRTR